ncbi:siderophore-iron reductase FhuF [Microvirga terrestris]|uniref:Siderophore-iron reductase FhuF n=1 Tax=Microvirga terrestris TaxID=2791024 RepID=A0ABS0HWX3_9HYPH|nr:siderophore-iron reductase FhuF [Microvirga terrestris]MBF9197996.1 siderophore-iron reductase FhuF [Microvirga terrestris]
MIPSLAPCFTGIFVHYKDTLALPGEHDSVISGRDLLNRDASENLMARFSEVHAGGDRRAIVSMWTQWHFGALIIPTTAAMLLLGRDLQVDLERISVAVDDQGKTMAIVLHNEEIPGVPVSEHSFSRVFQNHVEPLIRHFAAQFRISTRLLWNNASEIFEWALDQAEAIGTAQSDALHAGRSLLGTRLGGSGQPNPMYGLARHVMQGETTVRQRKLCCLRYLLPGIECCGSICPSPPASSANAGS